MTSDFKALEKQLKRAIEKAHKAGVQRIGDKAKELCPVESGKTRDSIKIDPEKGTITQEWYIGIFQELGTEDMEPHPYMRPAFDHGVRRYVKDIKQAINNAIGI